MSSRPWWPLRLAMQPPRLWLQRSCSVGLGVRSACWRPCRPLCSTEVSLTQWWRRRCSLCMGAPLKPPYLRCSVAPWLWISYGLRSWARGRRSFLCRPGAVPLPSLGPAARARTCHLPLRDRRLRAPCLGRPRRPWPRGLGPAARASSRHRLHQGGQSQAPWPGCPRRPLPRLRLLGPRVRASSRPPQQRGREPRETQRGHARCLPLRPCRLGPGAQASSCLRLGARLRLGRRPYPPRAPRPRCRQGPRCPRSCPYWGGAAARTCWRLSPLPPRAAPAGWCTGQQACHLAPRGWSCADRARHLASSRGVSCWQPAVRPPRASVLPLRDRGAEDWGGDPPPARGRRRQFLAAPAKGDGRRHSGDAGAAP